MKKCALIAGLAVVLAATLPAQEAVKTAPAKAPAGEAADGANTVVRISAAEAKSHLEANAVITGKVAEVNVAERLIRLNFENPYPKQVFTAVIFAAKTNLFPGIEKLKDKTVEVTGKIADYRGRPEVVLTGTNQLRVVEKAADPAVSEKK